LVALDPPLSALDPAYAATLFSAPLLLIRLVAAATKLPRANLRPEVGGPEKAEEI